MLLFARFVMRDSGLPIHISTTHVTQVRLTIDGEPAIYLAGKETPIVVEGTLDQALEKLEAAAAGVRVVEPEVEQPAEAEQYAGKVLALPTAQPAPAAPVPEPVVETTAPAVAVEEPVPANPKAA